MNCVFKRYDELYAPVSGPANPFKTQQQAAHKNTLAGLVEDAHVNEFQFETQRRTFHRYVSNPFDNFSASILDVGISACMS